MSVTHTSVSPTGERSMNTMSNYHFHPVKKKHSRYLTILNIIHTYQKVKNETSNQGKNNAAAKP